MSTFILNNEIMRSDRVMNPVVYRWNSVLKKLKHRKHTWKQCEITLRFRFFNFLDKKHELLEDFEQKPLLSNFLFLFKKIDFLKKHFFV